jgi:type II secretory pathway pseudopilin PulG
MTTEKNTPCSEPRETRSRSGAAFSLIEILVVVALLSVIILGLMAMFSQTQRAFRTGLSQTDILESGRMATDMIARELGQVTPSILNASNISPVDAKLHPNPNFFAQLVYNFAQPLTGSTVTRTNIKNDVFFLVRENQTWTGIGYLVRSNMDLAPGAGPVGSLYRFHSFVTDSQFRQYPSGMFDAFDQYRVYGTTNSSFQVSKILDGVVSFRIRPFDTTGWVLPSNPSWYTNLPYSLPVSVTNSNILTYNFFPASGEISTYFFYSNAIPASVELEVGILEHPTFEHYLSIPVYTAQTNYLAAQAGQVHLFRQRVPARNVDPSAY